MNDPICETYVYANAQRKIDLYLGRGYEPTQVYKHCLYECQGRNKDGLCEIFKDFNDLNKMEDKNGNRNRN